MKVANKVMMVLVGVLLVLNVGVYLDYFIMF